MERRKKILLIVIIFSFLALVALMIALSLNQKSEPINTYLEDSVIVTRDQDTGELLENDPNLSPQTQGNTTITILGVEALVELGFYTEELAITKEKIDEFSRTRLNHQYSTITIQPQGLTFVDGVLLTNIRLGQSDILLPLRINADARGSFQIIIYDKEGKFGGDFDSGVTVIEPY
jgi:hypothetical protein